MLLGGCICVDPLDPVKEASSLARLGFNEGERHCRFELQVSNWVLRPGDVALTFRALILLHQPRKTIYNWRRFLGM